MTAPRDTPVRDVPPHSDPLVEAWRRWSDRFARNEGGDTPIRDAFAAGWDAAEAASPAPPDWCGLIGSFMGVEQYCGEPSASAWHQSGEWFKHEFVPLTLTPHRMKEAASPAALDVERLRAFFLERGWVIHMDDREGQPLDPFVDLARLSPSEDQK